MKTCEETYHKKHFSKECFNAVVIGNEKSFNTAITCLTNVLFVLAAALVMDLMGTPTVDLLRSIKQKCGNFLHTQYSLST